MSLAYSGVEPQPALAWQFENSNVDSVTSLAPSSQVSPGPAQLQGSAALVTNAPSDTATVLLLHLDGNFTDSSIYNQTVTNAGLVTTSTSVKQFGTASMSTPGTAGNYYLSATAANLMFGTSDFTIEFWVNPSSLSTQRLMGNLPLGAFNSGAWAIGFDAADSGRIHVDVNNYNSSGKSLTATTAQSTGTWYHIALVRSGTSWSLYQNGVREATLTSSVSFDNGGAARPVYIGWSGYSTSLTAEYFNGYLDEIRFTTGKALYTGASFTVPTNPFTVISNPPYSVSFPSTGNPYMNLGTSSPAVFNNSTSNLFVECWVYVNATAALQQYVIMRNSSPPGPDDDWGLRYRNNGVFEFYCYGTSAAAVVQSGAVSIGQWVHVSVSLTTAGNMYLFINGGTPNTGSTTGTPRYATGRTVYIGTPATISDWTWSNMYIRDLRVVQGGVVPTGTFVPSAAPFTYTLPSYVTGSGSVVFTLLGQFVTYPVGKYGQGIYINNGNTVTPSPRSWVVYNPLSGYALTVNNFSISSWIYPYTVNTSVTNTFFNMSPSAVFYTQFQLSTSGSRSVVTTFTNGSSYQVNSIGNLSTGQWSHHCITYSNVGATTVGNVFASYYINGVFQATSNVPQVAAGNTPLQFSILNKLEVGSSNPYVTGMSADSALDDLRIYNTALTATQVASVYSSQGAPAPSLAMPLPKYAWSFESSNVDYVSGISPSYSPLASGYAQLNGQATNTAAPAGSNVSLYVNGTTGTYMGPLSVLSGSGTLFSSNVFIEAWLYINSLSVTSNLLNHGTNWSCGFTTAGNFQGTINGQTVRSTGTVSVQTWTHVAFSYAQLTPTSNTMYVFINGSLSGSAAFTGVPSATNQNAYLGWDGASNYSNFYVQDMRVAAGFTYTAAAYRLNSPTTSFTPVVGPFPLDNTPPTYAPGSTVYSGQTQWSLRLQFNNISYVPGKYGNGIYFTAGIQSSTRTTITIPSLPTTSPFTISLWLKTSDPYSSTYRDFFAIAGPSTYIAVAPPGWRSPTLEVYNTQSGQRYLQQNIDTNWFHIVFVNDGSLNSFIVYFNGTTGANPQTSVIQNDTLNALFLGTNGTVIIDDLRIYNTALTSTQVQSIYNQQGMPGRGVVVSSTYLPTLPGYSLVAVSNLPSSFTLTQTSTGNVWTYGSGQVTDGGANPVLTLVADAPSDLYSAVNPGIWCRLGRQGGTNEYVRHFNFVMILNGYTANNFDFAWAFFLKNGTTNQVKIWNPYPGNGTGYWVQSGIQTAGRIAISTTDPAQAHIYTISSPPSQSLTLTGTPLFTQLSTAATSSAVGAFSLRAVNGVSVKAVNVRPVALVPPSAMSSNTPPAMSGYAFGGSGSYVASSSSSSGYQGWLAWSVFDNNPTSFWENQITNTGIKQYSGVGVTGVSNTYNTSTVIGPFSTTISGTAYSGEWVQIQLPVGIVLNSYSMYGRSGWGNAPNSRMPYTWYIGGSNDGSTWSLVDSQTGYTNWVNTPTTSSTFTTTNTTAYIYYRMVVTAINSGGNPLQELDIGQWSLYGSNASWNTDFYADRLGNLLTAPVVGQSLANWLGGATGYVTTWYDQSGAGNHATQATAANQPVIQKATKGAGYSCLFSGAQSFSYGTTSTFANTPFSISIALRRSNGNNRNAYTGWGDTGANVGINAVFLNNGATDTINFNNRGGTNLTSVPVYSASEPVYYLAHTLSSNFYSNTYLNGSYNAQSSWGSFLSPASSNNAKIGYSPAQGTPNTFYGEIYELLVFTKSLYDLDTSGGLVTQIYQNQLSAYGT